MGNFVFVVSRISHFQNQVALPKPTNPNQKDVAAALWKYVVNVLAPYFHAPRIELLAAQDDFLKVIGRKNDLRAHKRTPNALHGVIELLMVAGCCLVQSVVGKTMNAMAQVPTRRIGGRLRTLLFYARIQEAIYNELCIHCGLGMCSVRI